MTSRNSSWLRRLPTLIGSKVSDRHHLQAALGNSGWLLVDKVLRMGVGLLVGVWVARYLGPDRFGALNYALAFTTLFGVFANLGMDSLVVRYLVKHSDQRNIVLGSAFALKLVAGAVTFLVVIALSNIVLRAERLTVVLVMISSAGFFFQSLNVIDLYFQSKLQSKFTVYATNGAFVLMALVKVGLLLSAASLVSFAWAGLGETALAAVFLLGAYRFNHLTPFDWRYDLRVMRDLLRDSWPLILSSLSVIVAMRIDQIMIGRILNDKEVGIYAAATRISEMWYFVPLAISTSVFPILIQSKKHSEEVYRHRMQRLFTGLVWIATFFAILMTFLSDPVIQLLYGRTYIGSAEILRILIWTGIPISFGCVWSNWMLIENRTKIIFVFQLNAAIVNVILNLVLIPRFGIKGSAYATLISYMVGHTVLAALIKSQWPALLMLGRALFPIWTVRNKKPNESTADT